MAELLRVEPSRFCEGEAWFIFDDGRRCLRKLDRGIAPARSNFPTPAFRTDRIDACRGMDGRMYDSLSGLRRTYRADGNPQGENYTEIGNEEVKPVTQTFDRAERRNHIKAAIEDVRNGRVAPPPVVLED
jgi:hypothetical protein